MVPADPSGDLRFVQVAAGNDQGDPVPQRGQNPAEPAVGDHHRRARKQFRIGQHPRHPGVRRQRAGQFRGPMAEADDDEHVLVGEGPQRRPDQVVLVEVRGALGRVDDRHVRALHVVPPRREVGRQLRTAVVGQVAHEPDVGRQIVTRVVQAGRPRADDQLRREPHGRERLRVGRQPDPRASPLVPPGQGAGAGLDRRPSTASLTAPSRPGSGVSPRPTGGIPRPGNHTATGDTLAQRDPRLWAANRLPSARGSPGIRSHGCSA